MRSVNDCFGSHSADHRNATNRLIHWICVPAFLWAVIAGLWLILASPMCGRAGFWCGSVMIAAVRRLRDRRPPSLVPA